MENYVGKVTKSKTHFVSALKIKEKLDIRLEKLYAYAKLSKDINKNSYKKVRTKILTFLFYKIKWKNRIHILK